MEKADAFEANEQDAERWSVLGERLSLLVEMIGMDKCVHVTGKSAKQIKRYEKGSEPPLGVIVALATESGTSLDWIVHGSPSTSVDHRLEETHLEGRLTITRLRMREAKGTNELHLLKKHEDALLKSLSINHSLIEINEKIEGSSGSEIHRRGISEDRYCDDRAVDVPYFDVSASAGPGGDPSHGRVAARMIPAWVVDRLGGRSDRLRAISSSGISMLPTIGDGDLLVVDVSKDRRIPVDGSIYVLSIDNELLVKRLRRSSSGWILVSDNRELYPEEPIRLGAAVTIHGQVRWVDRKLS